MGELEQSRTMTLSIARASTERGFRISRSGSESRQIGRT
jgi:hypothetical protein